VAAAIAVAAAVAVAAAIAVAHRCVGVDNCRRVVLIFEYRF
jgi:hypothetical protein